MKSTTKMLSLVSMAGALAALLLVSTGSPSPDGLLAPAPTARGRSVSPLPEPPAAELGTVAPTADARRAPVAPPLGAPAAPDAPGPSPDGSAPPAPRRPPQSTPVALELAVTGLEGASDVEVLLARDGSVLGSARVRAAGPRFRAALRPWPARPADDQEVVVAVGRADGCAFGAVRAPLSRVLSGEPLRVQLEPTAALIVHVRREPVADAAGGALPGDHVRVALEPLDRRAPVELERYRAYRRLWLPAGSWSVSVSERTHVEERCEVVLVAGAAQELSIDLAAAPGARRVTGTLRTRSGAPVASADVTVQLAGTPFAWRISGSTERRRCATGIDRVFREEVVDGREVWAFTLDRVPPGELLVTADWLSDVPTDVRVNGGAQGDAHVELVQLDTDGPGMGFRIEPLEPGGAPPAFTVGTRALDGGRPLPFLGRDGRTVTRATPAERRLEWAVVPRSRGLRPVYGTERNFVDEGDGRWLATVRFERGFGTRVLVQDERRAPIAGALVRAAGAPLGVTDRDGVLELVLDEDPGELEVAWLDQVPLELGPEERMRPGWRTFVLGPPR